MLPQTGLLPPLVPPEESPYSVQPPQERFVLLLAPVERLLHFVTQDSFVHWLHSFLSGWLLR